MINVNFFAKNSHTYNHILLIEFFIFFYFQYLCIKIFWKNYLDVNLHHTRYLFLKQSFNSLTFFLMKIFLYNTLLIEFHYIFWCIIFIYSVDFPRNRRELSRMNFFSEWSSIINSFNILFLLENIVYILLIFKIGIYFFFSQDIDVNLHYKRCLFLK